MNTQKVAITIPRELVEIVDDIRKAKGLSRSKYISLVLREKVMSERKRRIKDTYNRVFSDESIRAEQLNCSRSFESLGVKEGQEW